MMMKKVLAIVIACLLFENAAFCADRKLAERYLEIVPVRNIVEATLLQLFSGDKKLVESILGKMDFSGINAKLAEKISSTFSDQEMKAAIHYYSSPEGKSFSSKMPGVIESVKPQLQEQILKSMSDDPTVKKVR